MVVITLTSCPARLRGDLTKWFLQIETGVYVGRVSARVRDEIWERICKHIKDGTATMAYNANNEQHLEFRMHNASRIPVDYDGLKLVLQEKREEQKPPKRKGLENTSEEKQRRDKQKNKQDIFPETYVIVDLETSGLDSTIHQIIEIGAIKVVDGEIAGEYRCLVKIKDPLPQLIVELTGITDRDLQADGIDLAVALEGFLQFMGKLPIVGHHVGFDLEFLRASLQLVGKSGLEDVPIFDTLKMAKKKIKGVPNYKLSTLTQSLSIPEEPRHRSLDDCRAIYALFEKMKKHERGGKALLDLQ
jgi:CRISPR-associated protein Cas2